MQTLFYSLLNITAKYHQNLSIPFRAIPFQSWAVFIETQCSSSGSSSSSVSTVVVV